MNEEWVVLRTCNSVSEADVVKSILEGDDIEVLLPDEHVLGANPLYTWALGGAKVMVRSSDFDRARAILQAVDAAEANSGQDGDEAE